MARLSRTEARDILRRAGTDASHNFHALRSDVVAALITEADARRYRAPKDANGSRARYFHAYVVRAAIRGE
jgi:hypothetical protein